MRTLICLVLQLVIIISFLGSVGCGDQKARWRARGREEAERDLAAGKLCLRTRGLPVKWAEKYHEMAKEQLGIEFEAVAGCVVTEELAEQTDGYNEPMRREIDRRFGPGSLDKIAERASEQYAREKANRDREGP
jgi:hypothetical protein